MKKILEAINGEIFRQRLDLLHDRMSELDVAKIRGSIAGLLKAEYIVQQYMAPSGYAHSTDCECNTCCAMSFVDNIPKPDPKQNAYDSMIQKWRQSFDPAYDEIPKPNIDSKEDMNPEKRST